MDRPQLSISPGAPDRDGEQGAQQPPRGGAPYFRRTSLAVAAARRFTLYETQAGQVPPTPILVGSPTTMSAAPSPAVGTGHSASRPISPRVARVQDRVTDPEAPPIGVTFGGISVGGTGMFGGRGAPSAAMYASPLREEESEDEDEGASRAAMVARMAGAHLHDDENTPFLRPGMGFGGNSASATGYNGGAGVGGAGGVGGGVGGRPRPARRRSSAAPPRYRWLSGSGVGNTGDEPGVDVRSARDQETYAHLKARTHVTVVDYSSDPDADDTNVRVDFPGGRLAQWLASSAGQRPVVNGKHMGVRWIHVAGLNWEVIKTLTIKFQLHPLAVEDALRSSRNPRSKCDFYKTHLYLQILVQHIHAPDRLALARAAEGFDDTEWPSSIADDDEFPIEGPRRRKPWAFWRHSGEIRLPEGVDSVFEPSVRDTMGRSNDTKKGVQTAASRIAIDQLSASCMVPIRKGVLSVFMMKDGTLISLCAHEIHEALEPIYERLEDEHSLLRRSGDVSMLAHALLDVTVDLAVEITQAFEEEILNAESKVLVQAQLNLVRRLHIIQAQITRFRRQLSGLLHACYILRDQDAQRAQAAGSLTLPRRARLVSDTASMATSGNSSGDTTGTGTPPTASALSMTPTNAPANPQAGIVGPIPGHHNGHLPDHWTPAAASADPSAPPGRESLAPPAACPTPTLVNGVNQSLGYFSPLAKVYMNDVIDHLEMVVSSAEQFVGTCDHLTDYVFNVLSFHTNNSMERLSIVTVVFLPLTFIASYFGMNFTEFPSLENPDSYFWRVAAPCTVAFFVVFSYGYIAQALGNTVTKLQRYRRERDLAVAMEK